MKSTLSWVLRLALVVILVFAAGKVAQRRLADGFATASRDLGGYSAAIEWDPTNPEFHAERSALLRERLQPREAVEDLKEAVRLNPHNWLHWGELAGILEISGETAAAEEAYRKAVQLSPQSGYTHWNLANFLLRSGDREGWLEALREAVAREAQYQDPAILLLLKAGVSTPELEAVWPDDRTSVLRLLRFLVPRRAEVASEVVSPENLQSLWRGLLEDPATLAPVEAEIYLRYLTEEGRFQALRSAWGELMTHNGQLDEDFLSKQNYVWDGGFETPPCERGLCWIIEASDDERVAWTAGTREDLSRLIRIEFLARSNKEYRNLRQTVIVDSDAEYEFSFRARADRVESDRGVYFQILDPKTWRAVRTEEILGTSSWTRRQTRFRVPPGSEVVIVDLRRDLSRRLGGQLSGTLWLDDIRIRRVEPGE